MKHDWMAAYSLAEGERKKSKRSYVNIESAARLLQGKSHQFGTEKVRERLVRLVKKIEDCARLTLGELEQWSRRKGGCFGF